MQPIFEIITLCQHCVSDISMLLILTHWILSHCGCDKKVGIRQDFKLNDFTDPRELNKNH